MQSRAQVKVAEHVMTGHRVAIKILNRKKIQAMDMEEKGKGSVGSPCAIWRRLHCLLI